MTKDRDMARMTIPLTTEAKTATRRPRSSGLGIAARVKKKKKKIPKNPTTVATLLRAKSGDPGGYSQLTFADGQVVAPLRLPVPDAAVDLLAADQLVSLPAPEGQRATHRHACAAFHVEGTPAGWQDGDAGHT